MVKTPGRQRKRQQSCPQYLRSTWPTINSDNDCARNDTETEIPDLGVNDMTSFVAAVQTKRIVPVAYTGEIRRYGPKLTAKNIRNLLLRHKTCQSILAKGTTSTSTSTPVPVLGSLGDTDDTTEDECTATGTPRYHRRRRNVSSSTLSTCSSLQRQAASLGSLTSSYSSLGERSTNTVSPLFEDGFPFLRRSSSSASLQAILDSDPEQQVDLPSFDQMTLMTNTVEDVVPTKAAVNTEHPNSTKQSRLMLYRGSSPISHDFQRKESPDSTTSLTAIDPSILILCPGPGIAPLTKLIEPPPEQYSPTDLCDLTSFLSRSPSPVDNYSTTADPQADLAFLRDGTSPVDDDQPTPPVWDIPTDDNKVDQLLPCFKTRITYRMLSESSAASSTWSASSSSEFSYEELRLLEEQDSSPCSSSPSRSSSSASSGVHDASDYLADVSSEEGCTELVFVWSANKQLRLDLKLEDSEPFVLAPRIPGVAHYGIESKDSLKSGREVSQDIRAFFNSRSIVHRLGPHGLEDAYDEEPCPYLCGFAFPVPPKKRVAE